MVELSNRAPQMPEKIVSQPHSQNPSAPNAAERDAPLPGVSKPCAMPSVHPTRAGPTLLVCGTGVAGGPGGGGAPATCAAGQVPSVLPPLAVPSSQEMAPFKKSPGTKACAGWPPVVKFAGRM